MFNFYITTFALFGLNNFRCAMGKYAYYSVHRGFKRGIFTTWNDCEQQVKGYPKAKFKGFNSLEEAENFAEYGDSASNKSAYGLSSNLVVRCTNNRNTTCGIKRPLLSPSSSSSLASCSSRHPQEKRVRQYRHSSIGLPNNNGGKSDSQRRSDCGVAEGQITKETLYTYRTCQAHHFLRDHSHKLIVAELFKFSYVTFMVFIKCHLPLSSDDVIEVYTDGACTCNGQDGAVAGIGVYWGENHPWNYSAPLYGRQTNSRAELHAITVALRQAKANKIKKLRVYSDSIFCVKALTEWINKWRVNGWKKYDGKDVINKDDFLQLDDLLPGMDVQWIHVRGHQGIPGNEAADKLATDGILKNSKFRQKT